MVYVDRLRRCRPWGSQCEFRQVAHLTADTPLELHAFAERLGLRLWHQQMSRRGVLHYDLTPGMRAKAVRMGARDGRQAE